MPQLLRHAVVAAIALLIAIATVSADTESPLDEPISECGEPLVVFAMEVDSDNNSAYVELPAGVYDARLIARGSVDLASVDRFRKNTPTASMVSWIGERSAKLTDREIVNGSTIFSSGKSVISTPGGIARVSVGFTYSGYGEWEKSSQWRWEIIRPGVCAVPVQPEDE